MRAKIVMLGGGLALIVVALIFGSKMCAQAGAQQQRATQQAGAKAAAAANQADPDAGDKVPNVMHGGLGHVNQNLRQIQQNVQDKVDKRPGQLDKAIERSKTGQ